MKGLLCAGREGAGSPLQAAGYCGWGACTAATETKRGGGG